ncbi:hypothetical protein [Tenacibaculum agarivorans]|uniref:hypothetical protein n=1 Tax=Tenacibaculum agarivorans TaxID=1908389 RepID=UPI00094B8850|nr:hypothetical protein [Tenacibaculum agarivorans]
MKKLFLLVLLALVFTIGCEKNEEVVIEEEIKIEAKETPKLLNLKQKTKRTTNNEYSTHVVLLYPEGLTAIERQNRRNLLASRLGVTITSIEFCHANVDAETVEFRNLIVFNRTDGAGVNDPVEGDVPPYVVTINLEDLDSLARSSGLLAASNVQTCETIRALMYLGDIRN